MDNQYYIDKFNEAKEKNPEASQFTMRINGWSGTVHSIEAK